MLKFLMPLLFLIQLSPETIGTYGTTSNEYPDGSGAIAIGDKYYRKTKLIIFENNQFELIEQNGGLYSEYPRMLTKYAGSYQIKDSSLILNSTTRTHLNLNKELVSEKAENYFSYDIKTYELCDRGRCLSRWNGTPISELK